jgi:acyl-CoA reductase-like NAD-dependent aldehyde dehydrogenase
MLQIPLLRAGETYTSLAKNRLQDVRTGEPVAEVSLANPGLIARELVRTPQNQQSLSALTTAELIGICGRAARLFMEAELPIGDQTQSPEEYLAQLSATSGMPVSLGRANMAKIHFVLDKMEMVLAGLTRGLDASVLDSGFGMEEYRRVSFRRETDALGVILPSNSPGVHSLWIPAVALKIPLVLKPGRQEPWTPFRIAQALLRAGCPPAALGFYPTDYAGAAEILLRCGRSMLFGDRSTVEPWVTDSRVQIHGPGWSKLIVGPDMASEWPQYIDLMAESVTANCGRSCVNASGVWTALAGREIAQALAEKLATIRALPLDDPEARLAAFPSAAAAQGFSRYIDSQLAIPGAVDMTAELRATNRVVEVDGCAFLLPTVVYCDRPDHPLAAAEFLFPFVSVVEVPANELVHRLGSTLVATALTHSTELQTELLTAPNVERLNLGPIATCSVAWDQPHEGNLFEHLYRQRALQAPILETAVGAGA